MMILHRKRGFSLIEVVIAIGVVAGGVAVILALLPGLMRQTEDADDLQTALRLPDAIESRLITEMAGNFPGGVQNGLVLIADKAGSNIWRNTQLNIPPVPAYFFIDVRAFTSGELAYQAGRPVLPLQVRIAWPYAAVEVAGGLDYAGNYQAVNFIVTLAP
jgi:prepilin-type N-terminal cleavage/methylation domain-containing protein